MRDSLRPPYELMYLEEEPDLVTIRQQGCPSTSKPICVLKYCTVPAVYDFLKTYKGPGLLAREDGSIVTNTSEYQHQLLPPGDYTYEIHDLAYDLCR
jgi:hypothetical protein